MIIRAIVVLSFGAFLIQMPNSWAKKFAVALSPQQLVLKLLKDGSFEEVYNGPGAQVWARCNKPHVENKTSSKRGQHPVRPNPVNS